MTRRGVLKALAAVGVMGLSGRLLVHAVVTAGGGLVQACAAVPDPDSSFTMRVCRGSAAPPACDTPNFDVFADAGVNDMMLKRCGTLDCHGQAGRPLRLVGQDSFRLPPDGGGPPPDPTQPTTPDDRVDDFVAIMSLEPEEMMRVAYGQDDPNQLLLIRKPTGQLVHKGNDPSGQYPVLTMSSDGYLCLYCWLKPGGQPTCDGVDVAASCANASMFSVGDGG